LRHDMRHASALCTYGNQGNKATNDITAAHRQRRREGAGVGGFANPKLELHHKVNCSEQQHARSREPRGEPRRPRPNKAGECRCTPWRLHANNRQLPKTPGTHLPAPRQHPGIPRGHVRDAPLPLTPPPPPPPPPPPMETPRVALPPSAVRQRAVAAASRPLVLPRSAHNTSA